MSFSKSQNCSRPTGSCNLSFLKNSQVHIIPKLNEKPYDYLLIIYMEKCLHSDWLREMQFSINTVQNRGNSVQKVLIRYKLQIMEQVGSSPWLSFDIWSSILWSPDSCQNKVSAEHYYMTISRAQVYNPSR